VDNEQFKSKIRKALKDDLEVTPGVELVESGTLERTMFKAKRVVDERAKAE
jgi:phenylacetate-coenzyme A ligase PaaK-like adenylate-forming protein